MKTILLSMAVLAMTTFAFGQSVNVPQAAQDQFNAALPGTSVHWTESNGQILGQFKNSGYPAGMRYELDGTFIRKETRIQVTDLPQAAQDHIQQNAAEQNVISVYRIENNNTQYIVNIGGSDHTYDENGELMGTSASAPFEW